MAFQQELVEYTFTCLYIIFKGSIFYSSIAQVLERKMESKTCWFESFKIFKKNNSFVLLVYLFVFLIHILYKHVFLNLIEFADMFRMIWLRGPRYTKDICIM